MNTPIALELDITEFEESGSSHAGAPTPAQALALLAAAALNPATAGEQDDITIRLTGRRLDTNRQVIVVRGELAWRGSMLAWRNALCHAAGASL